jgi:mono/diheme cytochrome c family protein
MSPNIRRAALALAGALAVTAIGTGPVSAQDAPLPDGPGKAELSQTCTQCHGLEMVIQRTRTPDEWAAVVARMKGMGATMDDTQQAAILAYLNTNLGKPGAPAAVPAAPATPSTPAAPATPATPPTAH